MKRKKEKVVVMERSVVWKQQRGGLDSRERPQLSHPTQYVSTETLPLSCVQTGPATGRQQEEETRRGRAYILPGRDKLLTKVTRGRTAVRHLEEARPREGEAAVQLQGDEGLPDGATAFDCSRKRGAVSIRSVARVGVPVYPESPPSSPHTHTHTNTQQCPSACPLSWSV
ncbi:unnamed protein product [Pleuronectes platessa]|uniref:Uncharacterized protein n=1 Tax=Pleuronectes platessa TaxID=8262 RepID=A0A9N7Z8F6_PLEPL|nr:unnamed protein product [Pleuronectes platessa]